MRGIQRWLVCNVYTALMYIQLCTFDMYISKDMGFFPYDPTELFCKVINLLERVFPHYISHYPRFWIEFVYQTALHHIIDIEIKLDFHFHRLVFLCGDVAYVSQHIANTQHMVQRGVFIVTFQS